MLLGLAITELASISYSEKSRKKIEEIGTEVMENAIKKMKEEKQNKIEESSQTTRHLSR